MERVTEGVCGGQLVNDTPARARIGRINSLASLCVFPLISRAGFAYWNPADLAPFRVFVCGESVNPTQQSSCHSCAELHSPAEPPASS